MTEVTKINPSTAITELEPYEMAQTNKEVPTTSLLSKDYYGHSIEEPDENNPTRWRYERPLDTVRAWQYLIDCDENFKTKPHREQNQYRPTADSFRPLSFASMESKLTQRLSRHLSKTSSRHSRL
ncbi:hypothetical protein POMI540_1419 [Schizosaccharomyces pombe]|uniref:Uncharacterized protein C19C7.04c n=1 Tax=Schizosaccharomyces pombe (strain 972 / ATCC 24843) TaxID=284812 RepID=YHY4_SCHPO|nr:uncharacterized protein SPBC19C7.04c [Schizosaccharomyces pombe]O60153.1 RecName: Full=Uncharacterized protein C19C7.04c [Schizosaccharomyces pombe 972h-]CAA19572.1 conserved fungal protein [Schizosaccharomyces pombe]|eukprot:NP_596160.1 uncharacterized protein SPBC19C7.04c [Schizosaccharomyces pombe]